jgi:hypothetical protein
MRKVLMPHLESSLRTYCSKRFRTLVELMSWLTQQQELELRQAESRTVVLKLPSFGDMSGFFYPVGPLFS